MSSRGTLLALALVALLLICPETDAPRWIWLLPPNGTDRWLSRGSRACWFDPRELRP